MLFSFRSPGRSRSQIQQSAVLQLGNGLEAGQKRNLQRFSCAPDPFLRLRRQRRAGCNAACSSRKTGGLYPGTSVGAVLLKVE